MEDLYTKQQMIEFGEYISNSDTYHYTIQDLFNNFIDGK